MQKMLSCKEAADLWNFTERWVSIMCKEGRIPGAVKQGHKWMIPADTQKPVDSRIKTGAYRKEGGPSNLPLPAGVSDYRKACTEYYYVDKTLFIKEFLDQKPPVSLFVRPRRFGKTLIMDMLRTFFENTGEDTSRYFQNRRIWSCGESYRRHQGMYPVIYFTFKDIKFDTWGKSLRKFGDILQYEYSRHSVLAASDKLSGYEKNFYEAVVSGKADEIQIASSLFNLCRMLHEHYGTAPVLLIDDYDTPLIQSKAYDYYDPLIFFLQNLFSGTFKDNPHLSFGILAGTHKFPSENIFRDYVAPRVFSFTDHSFRDTFGFTQDEVIQMAAYSGMSVDIDELIEWYGGYSVGDEVIMNPWSVVSCLANGGQIQPYWAAAGAGEILRPMFRSSAYGSMEHLRALFSGKSIRTQVDLESPDPDNPQTLAEVYGLLVHEGYLHIVGQMIRPNGVILHSLEFPNKEVSFICRKELLSFLKDEQIIAAAPALLLQDAIYTHNAPRFQQALKQLLYQSIRNNKEPGEAYYQSLFTGLMLLSEEAYSIEEAPAAPDNYELQLIPLAEDGMPEVKIEIKAGKTVKLLYSKQA